MRGIAAARRDGGGFSQAASTRFQKRSKGGRARGGQARSLLRERLVARRAEIEQAVWARVTAIAAPGETVDPAYVDGLRHVVACALAYAVETIERGDGSCPPIPGELRAQARLAALSGVSLDTVLRRYIAGHSLLGNFLIEEASRDGLMDGAELQRLVAAQGGVFDRLLAELGEEYRRETEARRGSSEQRHGERIERLLAGELVDTSEIAYDFDGWHLGVVAAGAEAEAAVRRLAGSVDCRLILLSRAEGALWAWLGARRRLDPENLLRQLTPGRGGADLAIALGDPAEGLSGWRLTHRQAAAALPVAARSPERTVRYADKALLAAALRDDLLTSSLHQLYLAPLQGNRDGGKVARETLCAYFAADRNVSSAAVSLGVKRHTVTNRLRSVEGTIGRPLDVCAAELDTALRLEQLADSKLAASP